MSAMRTQRRRLLAIGLAGLLACAAAIAEPARAQSKKDTDPANCPYCHNDPVLLKQAGLVSHGGFPFGVTDTAKVDEFLSGSEIRWIETANFRIGFALGSNRVKFEEKKKFLAELGRLALVLPEVKPDAVLIDPWLRTHLYAQRAEEIHKRFVQLIQAENVAFADGSGKWEGDYKGEGPYLGMKEKYEVLLLPTEAMHAKFLTEHAGLQIKNSQRWHFIDRGKITLVAHTEQGKLRVDEAMHAHLAFNLAHNFYDGLLHYSYDTPVWLHEGIAHLFEREVSPKYNSFDSGEGAVAEMSSKSNWQPEVMKLIAGGQAPRMAELMSLKSYAELKLPHHFTTWSMIDYLTKTQPDAFAKFLWAIKSCKDSRGVPTGENLGEYHRQKFKETLEMSYAEFDEAWRAWAMANYKPTAPALNVTIPIGGTQVTGGDGN
jgi:hypothetical protein